VLSSIAEADDEDERETELGSDSDTIVQDLFSSQGSSSVPGCDDTSDEDAVTEQRTTVLVRNLPSDFSTQQLVQLLDDHGFGGTWDFTYAPCDFQTGCGFGYAVVNFVLPSKAQQFRNKFEGFQLPSQDEALAVVWSPTRQGFQALQDRYERSVVMDEAVPLPFKPLFRPHVAC